MGVDDDAGAEWLNYEVLMKRMSFPVSAAPAAPL
jgi:hypothetical protein